MPSIVLTTGDKTSKRRGRKGKGKRQRQSNTQHQSKVTVQVASHRQKQTPRPKGPRMSECASKYMASVARPFSAHARGACLPHPPDRASLKVDGFSKFFVTTDSLGSGFVLVSPCLANDRAYAWCNATSGTIPFAVNTTDTAPVNYSLVKMSTLPFNAQTISSGNVEGRIVAIGIRVTYLGSVSNMAGVIYHYSDPAHANVNLAEFSAANLIALNETKVVRVTAKAFEVGHTLVRPEEANYSGIREWREGTSSVAGATLSAGIAAFYPWSQNVDINNQNTTATSVAPVQNGAPSIVMAFAGTTPGSQFMVELIQHCEYVGRSAQFGLTPSHNDTPAASVIQAAADSAPLDFNATPGRTWAATLSNAVKDIVRETQTPMGRAVTRGLAQGARTWIGSRQKGALRLQ